METAVVVAMYAAIGNGADSRNNCRARFELRQSYLAFPEPLNIAQLQLVGKHTSLCATSNTKVITRKQTINSRLLNY